MKGLAMMTSEERFQQFIDTHPHGWLVAQQAYQHRDASEYAHGRSDGLLSMICAVGGFDTLFVERQCRLAE